MNVTPVTLALALAFAVVSPAMAQTTQAHAHHPATAAAANVDVPAAATAAVAAAWPPFGNVLFTPKGGTSVAAFPCDHFDARFVEMAEAMHAYLSLQPPQVRCADLADNLGRMRFAAMIDEASDSAAAAVTASVP